MSHFLLIDASLFLLDYFKRLYRIPYNFDEPI